MPTPLTDADKVIRNDTGKEIADAIRDLAAPEADKVAYDNTSSGLTADNAQDAIDELKTKNDTQMDKANPTGTGSLSIGRKAETQTGSQSVAVGYNVEASGARAVALGHATAATGANGSFAEGYQSKATGAYGSHAEGNNTTASGENSHAEGNATKAEGNKSHAEGQSTIARGVNSHAEGSGTKATADHAHAEGYQTEANGNVSHAAGFGTVAKHRSQYVFGEYNEPDPSSATVSQKGTYVEIVGNGTANVPKNARTLDWNGNETLAGDLTINSNQSMSVVTSAIYSYRFNNSANVEISAFEYSSFIILGYAQGVGSVAILITINNGTIQNIINMKDGNSFSSSDLTFTYANSKLVITSTKAAYSTLTVIKGSP